jgi:hypothetical protein
MYACLVGSDTDTKETSMDLTTATPAEIDAAWSALDAKRQAAATRVDGARVEVFHAAGARRQYGRGRPTWTKSYADAAATAAEVAATDATYVGKAAHRALGGVAAAEAAVDAVDVEIGPFVAEWDRRGGWTRAFLAVGNGQLHVHSSQSCSTCNKGKEPTQFQWMIQWSGADREQIITDAGERACTVCYPGAPVGATGTKMFSQQEIDKAAAKVEREAAKAARAAKAIAAGLTADGSEFVTSYVAQDAGQFRTVNGQREHFYGPRETTERFKTERSAVIWAVDSLAWSGRFTAEREPALAAIAEAVAAKHGKAVEDVRAEWVKKAAKKR